MRAIDSDSFNKKVWEQIERIKYIIENRITPENIKYFDGEIIKYARDLLANEDYLKIDWSANSNVNSYELSKLRQMIDYLKHSQTQRYLIGDSVSIPSYRDRANTGDFTSKINIEKIIRIPKNYDGRNSFWTYSIIAEDGSGQVITPEFFANNGMNCDESNDCKTSTILISKRKSDVKVSISIPNEETTTFSAGLTARVDFMGLVWRLA